MLIGALFVSRRVRIVSRIGQGKWTHDPALGRFIFIALSAIISYKSYTFL